MTELAYFRDPAGPRMLIAGSAASGTLSLIRIAFLDAAGQPLTVDTDGDGTPDTQAFDLPAHDAPANGLFLVENQSAAGFEQVVPQISASAVSTLGATTAALSAVISDPPSRAVGETCDYRGFDACAANLVCYPGLAGEQNQCAQSAASRATECASAPVLDPDQSPQVSGAVAGASLWDAPSGCLPNDVVGRPEMVIQLHLATAATSLTLHTVDADFDAAIYALSACQSTREQALGCNDDGDDGTNHASLTLTNLPAGDSFVIVEAVQKIGGKFTISATRGT